MHKFLYNQLITHIDNSNISPTRFLALSKDDITLCATNPKTGVSVYFRKYFSYTHTKGIMRLFAKFTAHPSYSIAYTGYRMYSLQTAKQLFEYAEQRYNKHFKTKPEQLLEVKNGNSSRLWKAESQLGLEKILLDSNNKSKVR